MVTLPVWFVLTFDCSFGVLELASLAASVWLLVDSLRYLRSLRAPDAQQAFRPDSLTWLRRQRRGDVAIAVLSIVALGWLSLFAFGAAVEAAQAQRPQTGTWGDLILSIGEIVTIAVLGLQNMIRLLTRIRLPGAIKEFGVTSPETGEGRRTPRPG